ncbi:hypothetical protein WN943_016204 [Citrus x changshan-huyou]
MNWPKLAELGFIESIIFTQFRSGYAFTHTGYWCLKADTSIADNKGLKRLPPGTAKYDKLRPSLVVHAPTTHLPISDNCCGNPHMPVTVRSKDPCTGAAIDDSLSSITPITIPSSNVTALPKMAPKVYALNVVGVIPDELWNLTSLFNLKCWLPRMTPGSRRRRVNKLGVNSAGREREREEGEEEEEGEGELWEGYFRY